MSKYGPYKPFAVFLKVGPHYYAFLGTFQCASVREALLRAKETFTHLEPEDRLIAWPWDGAVLSDGTKPRTEVWAHE